MSALVDGLPLHPLVVHVVVVLVPLSAVGALLVAARPRWARAHARSVAVLAVVAAVAAVVAQQAGEALEPLVSSDVKAAGIEEHGRWGLWTVNLTIAFAVATVLSAVLVHRLGPDDRWRATAGWVASALGVAATVVVYLAGESGARSVWGWVGEVG